MNCVQSVSKMAKRHCEEVDVDDITESTEL